MVIQMQDEIASGAIINTDLQQESKETIQSKISSLQQAVAESNLAEQLAKDDCSKLFEMLELLKEKYATLMEQNVKQATELIKSEEDKLSMARALVELKLLQNDTQEVVEKDKFETASTILANKNEIFELDEALQQHKLQLQETQEKLLFSEASLEKERESSITTRAALVEVRTQLEKESERNIELSAELLTVVNQREVFASQLKESQKSEAEYKKSLDSLASGSTKFHEEFQEMKTQLLESQEEVIQLRQSTMMAEIEVSWRWVL